MGRIQIYGSIPALGKKRGLAVKLGTITRVGLSPELNPRFSSTSFDGLLLLKANRSL